MAPVDLHHPSGQTGAETHGHNFGYSGHTGVLNTEFQLALPKQRGWGGTPLANPAPPAPQAGPGQKGKGWVLHYCCGTLRHPWVVHTYTGGASGTSI